MHNTLFMDHQNLPAAKLAMRKDEGAEGKFPGKLHDMMDFVESNGLDFIVSWVRNGRAIKVHDPQKMVEILPLFFDQTKYRSFQRQLNMWSFERIMEHGPDKGAFRHPLFVRGKKSLCKTMNRLSFKLCSNLKLEESAITEVLRGKSSCNFLSSPSVDLKGTEFLSSGQASVPMEIPQLKLLTGDSNAFFCSSLRGSCVFPSHESLSEEIANDFEPLMSDAKITVAKPQGFPNAAPSSIGSSFQEGDVVDFEGRSFYFLDLGLKQATRKHETREEEHTQCQDQLLPLFFAEVGTVMHKSQEEDAGVASAAASNSFLMDEVIPLEDTISDFAISENALKLPQSVLNELNSVFLQPIEVFQTENETTSGTCFGTNKFDQCEPAM